MAGVKELARNAGVRADKAQDLFQALLTMLGSGEYRRITIKGFGTFRLVPVRSRVLSTPIVADGAPIQTSAGHTIRFNPSDNAKARVTGLAKASARPKGGK